MAQYTGIGLIRDIDDEELKEHLEVIYWAFGTLFTVSSLYSVGMDSSLQQQY